MLTTIVPKHGSKMPHFTYKWTTVWHHGMVHALLNTHLPSFDGPNAMKEQRPSLETPAWRSGDRLELSGRSSRKQPKTAQKRPFWDTKWGIEQARWLETQRNLVVVMRLCSPVVLSYLDAGFEPRCGHKDFLTACCCLLLAAACCCYCCCLLKRVAHPWTLKGGVKPQQGKPSSVIKTQTRTELGPSLA